jgi:DNA-binding NarL/FixJ family response regulator
MLPLIDYKTRKIFPTAGFSMKTIVLIEDHDMMRRGLAAYFAKKRRWKVIGEAADLDEAAALLNPAPCPTLYFWILNSRAAGVWTLSPF